MNTNRILQKALIIGASRGLGLALADEYLRRGWRVVATVRGSKHTRLHDVAARGEGQLEIEQLDVVHQQQTLALRQRLTNRSFDLLMVNAGVANGADDCVATVGDDDFIRVMTTNALGAMRVVEALGPLVSSAGTIAVMSSNLGSVAQNVSGGWEVYRASKAALNSFMRSYAARHKDDRRSLVLISPGWVRTDMGGPHGLLSVDESIPAVVDVITAQAGVPGLRFLDYRGKELPW